MEITSTKKYTLRRLNATDIFAVSRLISKIGLKEFAKAFEGSEISAVITESAKTSGDKQERKKLSDKALESIGLSAVLTAADVLFEKLPKCENELFTLLSRVSGLTVDEIKAFEPATFAEMVIDFFKKEEVRDFFAAVSKSLGMA